jgi:membrane protein required for beta-lactamase induction
VTGRVQRVTGRLQKVTGREQRGIGRVQKVMNIAAIKWTLLTAVFIGQDKTQGGGVLHTFAADGKIFRQNYLGILAKQGKPICPSKNGTISLQTRF